MTRTSRREGLTIVEVLIALAIIGVAFTILSVALVGSLQNTERAGTRTQTTHYLNFIGRLVAGGSMDALPRLGEVSPAETVRVWGYGTLQTAFPELPLPSGARTDPARYRAEVEYEGVISFAGAESVRYRITVCTQATTGGEACVSGTTLGPEPHGDGSGGMMTGVN